MENILSKSMAILSGTPTRWKVLVDTIPGDFLVRVPAPGEWSAVECLRHVIDTERDVFPSRVMAFLAGQNFPAFNPAAQKHAAGTPVPSELVTDFAALRKASLQQIAKLTAKDLNLTAIHGELGKVTLGEMLNEWAGHDLMHLVQAERAILQPFIINCGPWRKYFSDHDEAIKKST